MLPGHFWQGEMVRREKDKLVAPPTISAAEKAYRALQMLGLGNVTDELERLDIYLDQLSLNGKGNMRDLFHPTARYDHIKISSMAMYIPTSFLSVRGNREGTISSRQFYIHIFPAYFPQHQPKLKSSEYVTPEMSGMLHRLEDYFHRKNALQEKEYNYSYRSRQEL